MCVELLLALSFTIFRIYVFYVHNDNNLPLDKVVIRAKCRFALQIFLVTLVRLPFSAQEKTTMSCSVLPKKHSSNFFIAAWQKFTILTLLRRICPTMVEPFVTSCQEWKKVFFLSTRLLSSNIRHLIRLLGVLECG